VHPPNGGGLYSEVLIDDAAAFLAERLVPRTIRDGHEQIRPDNIGTMTLDQLLLSILPAPAARRADEPHWIEGKFRDRWRRIAHKNSRDR
jgi:hypothetical protein